MSRSRLLPPKVHVKHGRYFYVHKNKWHPLSELNEGLREMHHRLGLLTDDVPNTMVKIFQQYADSDLKKLRPTTQKQYDYFMFGVLNSHFGHQLPGEIKPAHIAQYLYKRGELEGAPVAANRERSCLQAVFVYAMRRGYAELNPCLGVPRNPEKPSSVEIPTAALAALMDRVAGHFSRVLQFAYLTGIRTCDLVLLKVEHVTPDGIEFRESKTGKRVQLAWTDTLRDLTREILEARLERLHRPYADPYKQKNHPRSVVDHGYLLVNRLGNPVTERSIISNMQRAKVAFTFRNIRPKAQTDAGDRNVLGHVGQMRERYTRRRKLVPVR